jgi:hypothetical protein
VYVKTCIQCKETKPEDMYYMSILGGSVATCKLCALANANPHWKLMKGIN